MTRYLPCYQATKLLREKSKLLRKECNCLSLWYYDDENNDIVICTNMPGLWIGKGGKDVNDLLIFINDEMKKYKINYPVDHINKIRFIECENWKENGGFKNE